MYQSTETVNRLWIHQEDCCVKSGRFLQDLFSAVVSVLQQLVLEANFCNEAGIAECEICH
jgi:hypothetical protein